jgi:hypothetical protein
MISILEEVATMPGGRYAAAKVSAIRLPREIHQTEETPPRTRFDEG